ncbi:hypothetical protein CBR_g425 [Chara braunii]|uniref:DDE Tnp4 domain-containing protein n=1 Tax=Chara braunii TaxID=69332 RepID=A0A388JQL0_CHABU|nr:hypothetical protein CBR_g425 [Chara braunii]|eukprot:GBG60094.1 hypothetical protein CBR_g425 [Chara braunii]
MCSVFVAGKTKRRVSSCARHVHAIGASVVQGRRTNAPIAVWVAVDVALPRGRARMEGCDGGGRAVLSRTERTAVAAAAVAVVRRYKAERAAGRMKAVLSRRQHRLLLQRVLDAPDCITTSEAVVQLCAAIGSGVLPRATPRWWMRRRTGGTWEDLRVCDDTTDDYFREKLRMSRRVFMEITEACAPHLQRQVTFYREPLQPDQIVAYALYRWATGESYDNSTSSFGIGRASEVRAVRDVTAALLRVYRDKISWLTGVVVDLDLRVLDVFVGYPGSCHDIRVIQLSSLSKRAEEGTLFRGPPVTLSGGMRTNGYILGDNGYPPSEWIVVPYGGISQHPDEERFDNKQKVARGCGEGVREVEGDVEALPAVAQDELGHSTAAVHGCLHSPQHPARCWNRVRQELVVGGRRERGKATSGHGDSSSTTASDDVDIDERRTRAPQCPSAANETHLIVRVAPLCLAYTNKSRVRPSSSHSACVIHECAQLAHRVCSGGRLVCRCLLL